MAYTATNWTNFPSTATPVNASNLNKIENELVALDTGKADESTVTTALEEKVDKVAGKGLSTNDFDNTYKNKLDGISEQANKVEITPVVTEGTTLATISIDGVDTDIKGSDIEVDDELKPDSTNPVQNKIIYSALNNILPEETAEGNPISITDASGLNAKSCEVTMNPIQDLHGQSAPYPAGGGKNKFDKDSVTASSITFENNAEHNTITRNGFFYHLPAGTYTLNCNSATATSYIYVNVLDSNGNFKENVKLSQSTETWAPRTVTLSNGDYLVIFEAASGQPFPSYDIMLQIELGSTATSYAPYSNICPISGRDSLSLWQGGENIIVDTLSGRYISNSGVIKQSNIVDLLVAPVIQGNVYTIKVENNNPYYAFFSSMPSLDETSYDGHRTTTNNKTYTVTAPITGYIACSISTGESGIIVEGNATHTATFPDTVYGGKLNFVSGKVVITHKFEEYNGTENWALATGTNPYFRLYIPDVTVANTVISSQYPSAQVTPTDTNLGVGNTAGSILFRLSPMPTLEEFKAMLTNNPVQICYEIATPTEITLTAEEIELLRNENVLWTDSNGNITLVYSADIKAYIDSQLNS